MKEKIVTEQNIARFEKELKKSEKTPNTIHKYVRDVRKLQTYADGRGLTRDLMIAYKKELEEQGGYKANSINSFLTAINRFCIVMKWNDLCIKTIKVQRTAFENEEKWSAQPAAREKRRQQDFCRRSPEPASVSVNSATSM